MDTLKNALHSEQNEKLESIRRYARLLDSQFKVPFFSFRFGIDPLLSLIPVLGTFSGLVSGLILIYLSHKKGASGKVKALMFKNLLIDYLIGLIPVYGNIKDFFYKANQKNITLLEEHFLGGKHQGSGTRIFILIALIIILTLITSILLFAWMLSLLMKGLGL